MICRQTVNGKQEEKELTGTWKVSRGEYHGDDVDNMIHVCTHEFT